MTQIASTSRSCTSAQKSHNGPMILLYHRVASLPMDPQLLCVSPNRFAEHLQALNAHGRIISMHELVVAIRDHAPLPGDAFVITFDDGYADNLHQAWPMLEAADAAATIYVATGDLEFGIEFWWDQLERIILVQASLPTSLTLRIEEQVFTWTASSINAVELADGPGCDQWNVLSAYEPSPRQLLYQELFDVLRSLPSTVRRSCLAQLNEWSGVNSDARDSHRRLTKAEISTLAGFESMEIGGHTVNHPVLSSLPANVQYAEIDESKRVIESIIGRKIASFSYPFGTKHDYSAATVQAVDRSGFASACANYTGVVDCNTALLELPRMLVRDWNSKTLLERIDHVRRARRAYR